MKAFFALYQAIAREFLRDRTAMILTMVLPLAMAGFFGLIFSKAPAPGVAQTGPSAHWYVPGMLGLALLWLGVFGTAPPLVQMREQQILRRFGIVPIARGQVLGALFAWRLSVGVLQSALLIAFGILAFHLKLAPQAVWLPPLILLGAGVFVTMGFALAGMARSTEGVAALGQLLQFPMMFLSGIFFPLDMLPNALRPVSNVIPLTYLADAFRQVMLGTPGLHPLTLEITVLVSWLAVLAVLSLRSFRWD